jgi:hypothetical protein
MSERNVHTREDVEEEEKISGDIVSIAPQNPV